MIANIGPEETAIVRFPSMSGNRRVSREIGLKMFSQVLMKTMPCPAHSFYKTWRMGIIAKTLAGSLNQRIKTSIISFWIIHIAIDGPGCLFPRTDPARMFGQKTQQTELFVR